MPPISEPALGLDPGDREGAQTLLRQTRRRFPFIERIVADGDYAGPKMRALVARTGSWTLEIVKRSFPGSHSERWRLEVSRIEARTGEAVVASKFFANGTDQCIQERDAVSAVSSA